MYKRNINYKKIEWFLIENKVSKEYTKDRLIHVKNWYVRFLEAILIILNDFLRYNIKKQMDVLDDNLFDYLCYWNKKYYRIIFVNG